MDLDTWLRKVRHNRVSVGAERCARRGSAVFSGTTCTALRPGRCWPRLPVMTLLDRISIDSAVRFGKPCVRGTRVTVGDVLGYLAGGTPEDQLLNEFPQLTRDDVRACLAYAAERERRTLGIPAA